MRLRTRTYAPPFPRHPQDPDFPRLSGARVVRIAVHPELAGAGYGGRCVELLRRYFQGEITGEPRGAAVIQLARAFACARARWHGEPIKARARRRLAPWRLATGSLAIPCTHLSR